MSFNLNLKFFIKITVDKKKLSNEIHSKTDSAHFDPWRDISYPEQSNYGSLDFDHVYDPNHGWTSFSHTYRSQLTSERDHDQASYDILNDPDYVDICNKTL